MTNKNQAFLDDLTELSKKHNIWIGGCGCCESPWANEGSAIIEEPEPAKYTAVFGNEPGMINIKAVGDKQ